MSVSGWSASSGTRRRTRVRSSATSPRAGSGSSDIASSSGHGRAARGDGRRAARRSLVEPKPSADRRLARREVGSFLLLVSPDRDQEVDAAQDEQRAYDGLVQRPARRAGERGAEPLQERVDARVPEVAAAGPEIPEDRV